MQERLLTCQEGLPKSGLTRSLQKEKEQFYSEQKLLSVLKGHAGMIQRGLRLLRQAHALYQQALRLNDEAGRTNTLEMSTQCRGLHNEWEISWPEIGHVGDARQRLKAHRDALLHSANGVALCAHRELGFALANFPQEALERYPHLCASMGANGYPTECESSEVSIVTLLSTVTMDDEPSASDTIERRLRTVSACECFAAHQLGLLAALQGGVSSNMQRLRVHINSCGERTCV